MLNKIKESLRITLKSLLANKARSFLTMLGIIIGVGAVIIIMAVGAGAQSLILSQIESLGTNLVGVTPGSSEGGPPVSTMGIVITTLTYDDAIALRDKKNVPNLIDIAAHSTGMAKVSWRSHEYETNLDGSTVGYLKVEGGEIDKGRFFNEEEERNLSKVAVLGSAVKKELFGDSEAIGQRIKIKKHTFEVIGIMAERGKVAMQDYDDKIILPVRTMQKILLGVNHLGLIRAKVDNEENINKAIEDIRMTMRDQHDIRDNTGKDDDFTILNAAQAMDMVKTVTNALKYFLAAVASLALVVGGIGIMNIMLVSVTQRTREIGLRKAIGANRMNILIQFLFEAVTMTIIGGIIGIISGVLFSYLVYIIATVMGYSWKFVISFMSVVFGVGISSLVGIVFGLYPANKASKLEPIEALRYE